MEPECIGELKAAHQNAPATLTKVVGNAWGALPQRAATLDLAVEYAKRIGHIPPLTVGAIFCKFIAEKIEQAWRYAGLHSAQPMELISKFSPLKPIASSRFLSIMMSSASSKGGDPECLGADLVELAETALLRAFIAEHRA